MFRWFTDLFLFEMIKYERFWKSCTDLVFRFHNAKFEFFYFVRVLFLHGPALLLLFLHFVESFSILLHFVEFLLNL